MTIAAHTKLGRYEILSQIGAGGMGEVYLAEDTRLHRKVALKILPENIATDKERLLRFERGFRSVLVLYEQQLSSHLFTAVNRRGGANPESAGRRATGRGASQL